MKIDKSNFSDWYNTIIKEAELCDLRYNLKGFIVFMPWSVLSMEEMYKIYESALQKTGHKPAWFPALIPEDNLKAESAHVEGFTPEVFWVTHAGGEKLEKMLAMRPTSETAMYPMYALWINGVKDLPLKIYQRAQVWRHETKATKPFIRSREFYWIEAHDVFATKEGAMNQVKEDMQTTEDVLHNRFGIPFLFFKRPQWDKFAGAENTYAADALLPDRKILQLPSTHMLGQNFAKVFGVKYMDEKGEQQYCWQTCYGPCISRIYAGVISTHGDERGLVLPFELAPIQVVIVPIFKEDNKSKVLKHCTKLKEQLEGKFRVHLDESENTPGFKFNHWELRGVPIRIELGERDMAEDSVMFVRRDELKKKKIKESELEKTIVKESEEITTNLRKKADAWFKEMLGDASNVKELKSVLETKGFVRVPFCTDELEGKACAEKLKEETSVNVRGSLFGKNEVPKDEKCIACGKKATVFVYLGRQY